MSASSSTPGSSTSSSSDDAACAHEQLAQSSGRPAAEDLVAQRRGDQRRVPGRLVKRRVDDRRSGQPPAADGPAAASGCRAAALASRPTVSGRTRGTSAGSTKKRVTPAASAATPACTDEYMPSSKRGLGTVPRAGAGGDRRDLVAAVPGHHDHVVDAHSR